MLECMQAGDRQGADAWRMDMEHLIRNRSPEQVARMECKLGLTPEPYFMNKADEDVPALLRRQAA